MRAGVLMTTMAAGAAIVLGSANAGARAPDAGIRVRGEWRIEVRDPDGTTVEAREFENAFVDNLHAVVRVLTAQVATGRWRVVFGSADGADLQPCTDGAGGVDCRITTPDATASEPASVVSKNLAVTTAGNSIVLSGSHVASRAGAINRVLTNLGTCPAGTAPDDCHTPNGGLVTAHVLTGSAVINVLAGQQVMVSVTISFAAN